MSKNYTHLSVEQRYQIEVLVSAGKTQKRIAELLKVHSSTISRELKRNTPRAGQGALEYRAKNAQRRTRLRHQEKPKRKSFTDPMKQLSREWLRDKRYSPELISVEGKKKLGSFVSHETIYKWIWYCKKSNQRKHRKDRLLYHLLKHGSRYRKRGARHDKRGNIPYRVLIDKRPSIVLKRKRLGDLEVDLMIGKNHQSAVLVSIDRASLKIKLRKLCSKQSEEVKNTLLKAYQNCKDWLKTITFDNDTAFMQHHLIAEKLNVQSYFTRPYTSQDKGSVENRIGILRRWLPKGTDLSLISPKYLMSIENKLNNRPVRKFNYKTPNQIFSEKIALNS